jgi:hypothetical protein
LSLLEQHFLLQFLIFLSVTSVTKNWRHFCSTLFDVILSELPSTVKLVQFWSDNAGSQFKNQFILEGIKRFESRYSSLKICWNFYAALHGKTVVDGIGGSVKRYVRQRILDRLFFQRFRWSSKLKLSWWTRMISSNWIPRSDLLKSSWTQKRSKTSRSSIVSRSSLKTRERTWLDCKSHRLSNRCILTIAQNE